MELKIVTHSLYLVIWSRGFSTLLNKMLFFTVTLTIKPNHKLAWKKLQIRHFFATRKYCYYVPHQGGGGGWVRGHIAFSEDPVGVGISVCISVLIGVASCLHSSSLMNGWILAKRTQIYHWLGEKCWLDFDDLDPIFKVTWGQVVRKGWKIACLYPISWRNKWILLGHVKELLDFGDLDPIFKVTWWLRWLENGLSASYLLNEWMDFYQTCTSILLRHGKELIRFWWPWSHFQGHRRAQIVGKWLVCTLSPEWMGGFWLNLYIFIVVTWKRTDWILMTLPHFQDHTRA